MSAEDAISTARLKRWERMDRMSELPDIAIEKIIERLPLRDAVRTSMLSRKWRYKWATLSTLSMDYNFVHANGYQNNSETFPGLVKTILLQHNEPLHKFVIHIPILGSSQDVADITLAIRVALMKGVQELSVRTPVALRVLPSFLFSCCEQLTKLDLIDCVFNPPFGFRGFSNLKIFCLSLGLQSLDVSLAERLSGFVSSCPKLRKFVLTGLFSSHDLSFRTPSLEYFVAHGSFRSILFKEAPNLVSLAIGDYTPQIEETIPSNDYMLQFFSNMAKIEYLALGSHMCHLLGTDCAPRKHSTILQNLKTIEAGSVNLGCVRQFHCILSLIMSSPKLQHIQIDIEEDINNLGDPNVEAWDYKGCCFQHLQIVEMTGLRGSNAELKLIEILLANSPLLQNLFTEIELDVNKASFSENLMQFRRASPTAQLSCIHVENY